jgi:hypothetical protein
VAGSCEHGNKSLGSIKCIGFFDQLSDSQFIKDVSPRSLYEDTSQWYSWYWLGNPSECEGNLSHSTVWRGAARKSPNCVSTLGHDIGITALLKKAVVMQFTPHLHTGIHSPDLHYGRHAVSQLVEALCYKT